MHQVTGSSAFSPDSLATFSSDLAHAFSNTSTFASALFPGFADTVIVTINPGLPGSESPMDIAKKIDVAKQDESIHAKLPPTYQVIGVALVPTAAPTLVVPEAAAMLPAGVTTCGRRYSAEHAACCEMHRSATTSSAAITK